MLQLFWIALIVKIFHFWNNILYRTPHRLYFFIIYLQSLIILIKETDIGANFTMFDIFIFFQIIRLKKLCCKF